MPVSLSDARGAIRVIRSPRVLAAAYRSYSSGHDDKHRSKSKAYSYNHISNDGNEPSSFYQKLSQILKPVHAEDGSPVFREVTTSAWGKTSTSRVPATSAVTVSADLEPADELALLQAAISSGAPSYYASKKDADASFLYACPLAEGYAGYSFSGGGKQFPKQAAQCDAMVIVVTRSPNVRIITHYPALAGTMAGWTKLA